MALGIAANLLFWAAAVAHELVVRGLFPVLGVDWSRFWGAARAYETLGPSAAYRMSAIQQTMAPLARFTSLGAAGVRVGPVPYPPIFVAFFGLFTLPSAPLGYLLWTLFCLALVALAAWRLAGLAGYRSTPAVALLVLGSFPLLMSLFAGQVAALLLVFLTEGAIALHAGRERRAGFWWGLLLLKPQYAVWLLLVFLLKRRWQAVLGASLASLGILLSSLAVGGVSGVTGYVRIVLDFYPRFQGNVAIDPRGMICWRAVVVTLLPHAGLALGLLLTALLSGLTLLALPLLWRGPSWRAAEQLAPRLLGTLCVTLLVAYHSQIHGAALLAVPGLWFFAQPNASRAARQLMTGSLLVMPAVGLISVFTLGDVSLVGPTTALLLAALLIVLLRDGGYGAGWRSAPALASNRSVGSRGSA